MKYILLFFLIYAFLKAFYYSFYEIVENENKSGGIAYLLIAAIGLISSSIIIFFIY